MKLTYIWLSLDFVLHRFVVGDLGRQLSDLDLRLEQVRSGLHFQIGLEIHGCHLSMKLTYIWFSLDFVLLRFVVGDLGRQHGDLDLCLWGQARDDLRLRALFASHRQFRARLRRLSMRGNFITNP